MFVAASPIMFSGEGKIIAQKGSTVQFSASVQLDAPITVATTMTIGGSSTASKAVTVEVCDNNPHPPPHSEPWPTQGSSLLKL